MNVLIIEVRSGNLVANLPVILQGANYRPSDQEYFAEAWRCAVEDRTVDPNRYEEYKFQLVRST